jgi:hypothetical protein
VEEKHSVNGLCRKAYSFFEEQHRDVLLLLAYFALPSFALTTLAAFVPSQVLGRSVLLLQLLASGLFLACIMSLVLRVHAWLIEKPESASEIARNLNSTIGPFLNTILAQVAVMAVPLFLVILIPAIVGGASRSDFANRLWPAALVGIVLLGAQFLFFYSWPMIAANRLSGFRNVKRSAKLAGRHPGVILALLMPLTVVYVIRLLVGGGAHPALTVFQTVLGGAAMLVTVVLQTVAYHQLHESEIAHD